MGVKQKRLKEIQSAHDFKNGFQNKSQKFFEEHRDIFKCKNKNVIFFVKKSLLHFTVALISYSYYGNKS